MTIEQIKKKLDAAGVKYRESGNRLYIQQTPNGSRGNYGFLVAGDDGSTGSCQGITRRTGEISAILRGEDKNG